MVRDEEIKRLVWYARGMGVKVSFKRYEKRSRTFAWHIIEDDEVQIIIYTQAQLSKMHYILTLIHELGHHKDFIAMGRTIPHREGKLFDKKILSKKDRFLELQSEIRGTKYWEEIYRDVGCTFPIQKLFKQMEYDIWVYDFIHKNGCSPKMETVVKKKKRELRKKHRC